MSGACGGVMHLPDVKVLCFMNASLSLGLFSVGMSKSDSIDKYSKDENSARSNSKLSFEGEGGNGTSKRKFR